MNRRNDPHHKSIPDLCIVPKYPQEKKEKIIKKKTQERNEISQPRKSFL